MPINSSHAVEPRERAARLRRPALLALFAVWVPALFLVVANLAAAHWYSLPEPDRHGSALRGALSALRKELRADGWSATHVLYGFCPCSRRVVEHLVARGADRALTESVLLVGDKPSLRAMLGARGFAVQVIDPPQLKSRWGIEAAPLLIVASPQGAIRYLGGYSDRKQGPVIRDGEIIARVMRGGPESALPLFGCAVSRTLQAALDPLGLKYSND